MSDIAVAEIPADDGERPLPVLMAPAKNALVEGPILSTLLWLAWPNVIALSAGTCVVIAETSYIGRLGVELGRPGPGGTAGVVLAVIASASEAIQGATGRLDCFVATLLAMTNK